MATLEEIRENRLKKIEELKKIGINPYPAKIKISGKVIKIAQAKKSLSKTVLIAGKIFAIREHGSMLFMDLKDESGKIQLWFQKNNLKDDFKILNLIDSGDYLAAKGKVIKSKTNEITLDVKKFQLLSKSLRPLPKEWYGLKDIEERYRKRYLDLLLNEEIRKKFDIRTKLVSLIRKYLDSLDYFEVETPILQPLYGGANAKPFKTHLNSLDIDVYLRIATELYLKRLIIGGYQRVYEIGKDFRNEGIDQSHFPEFTMIEWYEAYADYQRMMEVTEGLFKYLAKNIFGNYILNVNQYKIDIGKKWKKIKMVDLLKEILNLDINKETTESLLSFCKKNKIDILGKETKGQLIYLIFEHLVTDKLIEPTWVIDYPKDVSPLAKNKEEDSNWVDRFEGYIGGKEICDGWSELTDPIEQRKRFELDKKSVRVDQEEAQQVDEDFLVAMEYGMPPLGGIGIGIDRLTMFFTNTWQIKEVILFPTLRPKDK
ncbi:MAG TPA: lysine--tRNA ligase [Candidatus Paceibacterota bacterium]|jgi:lysyl-tRNA synthetase class 2|nr:lysine--tRNA ligase [Candidatus Paceibacterota bacterium]HRS47728.1 lysine--tRNA ligase [Candidatus Paceibacterota bacterium]